MDLKMSVGVDIVEIERFENWQKYKISSLNKIYSKEEIIYCLSNKSKSAERFAARFAAREAIYKALTPHLKDNNYFNLFTLFKLFSIISNPYPQIIFSNKIYKYIKLKKLNSTISWSHSKIHANATVIIY